MQEPRVQLSAFFPESLAIISISKDRFPDRERLVINLAQASHTAPCPMCGTVSDQLHSSRTKSAQDLPIMNCSVLIKLQTRRFFALILAANKTFLLKGRNHSSATMIA